MQSLLLPLHLSAAGLWLGCVLTEIFFERALAGPDDASRRRLAGLHRQVDLYVETPAFVLVLLSGLLMLARMQPSVLLWMKIAAGAVAVLANVLCVWLVFRRDGAARQGDGTAFARLDHAQHRYGAFVLLGLVLALALGLGLLAGG